MYNRFSDYFILRSDQDEEMLTQLSEYRSYIFESMHGYAMIILLVGIILNLLRVSLS